MSSFPRDLKVFTDPIFATKLELSDPTFCSGLNQHRNCPGLFLLRQPILSLPGKPDRGVHRNQLSALTRGIQPRSYRCSREARTRRSPLLETDVQNLLAPGLTLWMALMLELSHPGGCGLHAPASKHEIQSGYLNRDNHRSIEAAQHLD